MPIREILYPTDLSDSAEYAGRVAALLAHKFNALLHVLYVPFVFPPASGCYGDYIELQKAARLRGEDKLKQFCEEMGFRKLPLRTTIGGPTIKAAILGAASRSDLIVMRMYARARMFRALFGSVAASVIGAVECPILVIKKSTGTVALHRERSGGEGIKNGGASPFHNILIPLDESGVPEGVLRHVKEMVRPFEATITLLYLLAHECRSKRPSEMKRAEAETYLQALRHGLEAEGFLLRTLVRAGDSAAKVLDYAREVDADLIAMGTHDREHVSHGPLDKIARRVVARSEVPVLLCRVSLAPSGAH